MLSVVKTSFLGIPWVGTFKFDNRKEVKSVPKMELNCIKEVGKKIMTDFIHSETGSVGIKNAATIATFAGMLALGQSSSEAIIIDRGDGIIEEITITAI